MAAKRETRGAPNSRFSAFQLVSQTGSTNSDLAKLAAEGAPEGTVLIAESQTAGRGRQGRSWFSAEGSALAMSWLMRPESDPVSWGLIPLLTGLAAVECLHDLGLDAAKLKWPNDILVNDRKLAGILCESTLGPNSSVVVGLGMNLSWGGPRPAEIADIATSLDSELTDSPERLEIARAVLGGFERLWQECMEPVRSEGLIERYSSHCQTLQLQQITLSSVDGTVLAGRPTGVDQTGALVLRTSAGEVRATAGDVRHGA